MFKLFLLSFCQSALTLLFTVSFFSKIFRFESFPIIIDRFEILPSKYNWPTAILIVTVEFVIILLLVLNNRFLSLGFTLATILLSVFSGILTLTLTRDLNVSCGCFGANDDRITVYDLGRNLCFIVLGLIGLWISIGNSEGNVSSMSLLLPAFGSSTVFVLFFINISTLFRAFGIKS